MSIPLPREQHEEKREEHQGSLNKVFSRLSSWSSGVPKAGFSLLQLPPPLEKPSRLTESTSAILRLVFLAVGSWVAVSHWSLVAGYSTPSTSFFLFFASVAIVFGSLAYLACDLTMNRWTTAGGVSIVLWFAYSSLLLLVQGALLGLLLACLMVGVSTTYEAALPLYSGEAALALSIGLILPGQIYLAILSSKGFLHLKMPEVMDADRKMRIVSGFLNTRRIGIQRGGKGEKRLGRCVYVLFRRELLFTFLGVTGSLTALYLLAILLGLSPPAAGLNPAGITVTVLCAVILFGVLLAIRKKGERHPRPMPHMVRVYEALILLATLTVIITGRDPLLYSLFLAIEAVWFILLLRSMRRIIGAHPEVLPYRHLQARLLFATPTEQLTILEDIGSDVEKLYTRLRKR